VGFSFRNEIISLPFYAPTALFVIYYLNNAQARLQGDQACLSIRQKWWGI